MNEPIARCSACVLPRSEYIQFDENDVCQLCLAARSRRITNRNLEDDQKVLVAQIERIKERGRGRPYDALVGASGGRDSSVMLYQLVRRHGLRCLAAYHRTPFTPDEIDGNIRRLTADLDVPLVEMDISRDYHRHFAAAMTQLWLRKPAPIIANLACAPCKLHNCHVYKLAREYNVPAIVFGSNKFENFQLIPGRSRKNDTESAQGPVISLRGQLRIMFALIWDGFRACWDYPELLRYLPIGARTLVCISNRTPYLKLRYRDILSLDYFKYAPYNETDRDRILDAIGWELPPGCNTSWRADCTFAEIKNYMYLQMTGVTYSDAFFANMVRNGVLSREAALERLAVEGQFSHLRIEQACEVLGISEDSFSLLTNSRSNSGEL